MKPGPDASRRVLLTVSGDVDPRRGAEAAAGRRPRADYLVLADTMGADLLDVGEARRRHPRAARLLPGAAGRFALVAWACFRCRRRYDVVVSDGEQVGLPLALLMRLTGRRPSPHVMIGHLLSVGKKAWLYRLFRLGRYVDTVLVYSSRQQRFVVERLGQPSERVVLIPFMVDTRFFAPNQVVAHDDEPMICTAGLEFRDYPTLLSAAGHLDVKVVIAAASPWSKRADSTQTAALPPNVEVCRLSLFDLRQLYADARLVVMPLHDVEFQAGVTTILEAMAMAKAVVCSRTRGQTDVITDGVDGIYVEPGDPEALRQAITDLLADPARAGALGASARRQVERTNDIDVYARRLAGIVAEVQARHERPPSGRGVDG